MTGFCLTADGRLSWKRTTILPNPTAVHSVFAGWCDIYAVCFGVPVYRERPAAWRE